ncbi:MAG: glycoside hydrolase family 18 protein [Chitinophagaceae bacterium]|nr:glycoside hydrolase family 18 protein [Chitinophagaceae bacterium]
MKRTGLLLTLLLEGVCGSFAQNRVVAYFSGTLSQLDSFDVRKVTHLIFCFGHLDGSRFKLDSAKDTAMIQKMVSLRSKNPALKILVSMGGWGGCESCSDGFSTSEKRKEFAMSVKEITMYFKTDGVDIDWEYPTVRLDNDIDKNPVHKNTPEDKDHFTDLVRKLRNTLGKNATITFAAGGFNTYLKHALDWKQVIRYIDFINLMTYDLINGYSIETGHHSPLYSTLKDPESVDHAVRYLVKNGVDPGKIVIGAAFYARIWENVPPQNNGLYQTAKFKESVPYNQFEDVLSEKNGYQYHWDDTAKAPYSYCATQKTFATYDDKRSVQLKTQYVIDNKLGGIMFWELGSDVYCKGLLDAIFDTASKTMVEPAYK